MPEFYWKFYREGNMQLTDFDKEAGIEHKFSPLEVMKIEKPNMASLLMTLETGLQLILKAGAESGWDGAEVMLSALLQSMREIMGAEISKSKEMMMVDIGDKKIN